MGSKKNIKYSEDHKCLVNLKNSYLKTKLKTYIDNSNFKFVDHLQSDDPVFLEKLKLLKKYKSINVPLEICISGLGEVAGFGVKAVQFIKRDRVIGNYVGTIVKKTKKPTSPYIFGAKDYDIDALMFGNVLRFVNHACRGKANVRACLYDGRIFFKAKRHIQPGEEIFIDYGRKYLKHFNISCLCHAKKHAYVPDTNNIKSVQLRANGIFVKRPPQPRSKTGKFLKRKQ